jgi:hypothetical protein
VPVTSFRPGPRMWRSVTDRHHRECSGATVSSPRRHPSAHARAPVPPGGLALDCGGVVRRRHGLVVRPRRPDRGRDSWLDSSPWGRRCSCRRCTCTSPTPNRRRWSPLRCGHCSPPSTSVAPGSRLWPGCRPDSQSSPASVGQPVPGAGCRGARLLRRDEPADPQGSSLHAACPRLRGGPRDRVDRHARSAPAAARAVGRPRAQRRRPVRRDDVRPRRRTGAVRACPFAGDAHLSQSTDALRNLRLDPRRSDARRRRALAAARNAPVRDPERVSRHRRRRNRLQFPRDSGPRHDDRPAGDGDQAGVVRYRRIPVRTPNPIPRPFTVPDAPWG